jgi:hypothetical protein
MSGVGRLLIVAGAASAVLLPANATRACEPWSPELFRVDPALAGKDQTPPDLGQPTVAEVWHSDDDSGCLVPKCGADNGASITNLATDDLTPPEKIGYRVTVIGNGPTTVTGWTPGISILPIGSRLQLLWDGDADFDFTVEIVAIDAAGNESAARTVRLQNDMGVCTIGPGGPIGRRTLALVALALMLALRRRPRPPRR